MKDFNMAEVGQRIRELRAESGLTQKELAGKAGVAQNTVAQYEKGIAKPSIEVVIKLAEVLGVTCGYLLCVEN